MNLQLNLLLQQANQAFQSHHFDRSSSILKKILQVNPKNLPALELIGLIKILQGDSKEASVWLGKAVLIDPNQFSIQYNLAYALADSGKKKESLIHHQKAITLAPNDPKAWFNFGKTVSDLESDNEAINYYKNAIELKNDFYDAWYNLGITFSKLKKYQEAIKCYEKTIDIAPNFYKAWVNRGIAFYNLKHYEQAIHSYEQAITLDANNYEAWLNQGIALHDLERFEDAIIAYKQANSLNPQIRSTHGAISHLRMKICSWVNFNEHLDELIKNVRDDENTSIPFSLLALTDDPSLLQRHAEAYSKNKYPAQNILGPIPKNSKRQKIRIGYFSADFRNHAVSILAAELFELHDKSKFEIIAFSFGEDDLSPMRSRLINSFDKFIDIRSLTDKDAATLSRELNIDIAVDLGGFTANNRTDIFAYRAAPIQISYLGYLGTMSTSYIDYLVADKVIIPTGDQGHYSEKIIYLPSYQVNDSKRKISSKIFTRKELGLPESGFIFCCFNDNYKILPNTFQIWMRILKATPKSVLFLYAANDLVITNLKKEAELSGISNTRLIFGGRLGTEDYLARYRVCDLFLDTFPYNAGTTASDALWAGLPVLTLKGNSFASRIASSLLTAINLPELITESECDYEMKAIELANSPSKVEAIKNALLEQRGSCPLFNTKLFTKHLEKAYQKMIVRHEANLPPDHIQVDL
jgi:predicted O-linked N-acetylglucosamine transferase (SPINDLY family)